MEKSISILLIEDCPEDHLIIRLALDYGSKLLGLEFNLYEVYSLEAAKEMFEASKIRKEKIQRTLEHDRLLELEDVRFINGKDLNTFDNLDIILLDMGLPDRRLTNIETLLTIENMVKDFNMISKNNENNQVEIVLFTGSDIRDLKLGDKYLEYTDKYINKNRYTLDKIILSILVIFGSQTLFYSYKQKFNNIHQVCSKNIYELQESNKDINNIKLDNPKLSSITSGENPKIKNHYL